ncbi:MAG: Holliday junction branch migration protein RuvA [Bdellovibrionales bacterium]|nr:Holliday junction branch migration protein RuvA [Bdellovibrionales bacterium]
MISQLTGAIVSKSKDRITIDVQGVGYEVLCSRKLLESLLVGEVDTLVIHTEVREDSIALYGFFDQLEKQVFLMLKTVKGLGAKSASDVLASIDTSDLLRAIGSSDVSRLQAVKGVGKKTAERIIVELRDKVGSYVGTGVTDSLRSGIEVSRLSPRDEAVEALCVLGFGAKEAKAAMDKVPENADFAHDAGELVKHALQHI